MQTEKHPYELLIRWDQSGALAGAHVQHRYVIRDGGAVISETLGQAEPLTLDASAGFPLGDLLAQTQIDALTAKSASDALRDAALAERDAAVSSQRETEQALSMATARIVQAEAERDAAASDKKSADQALFVARVQVANAQSERDTALTRVAGLEAQLAALQPAQA